jgi:hypothetical protein
MTSIPDIRNDEISSISVLHTPFLVLAFFSYNIAKQRASYIGFTMHFNNSGKLSPLKCTP